MAFKVNYNQQRAERNRVKQAKKDAKLREREDELARRRAAQQHGTDPSNPPEGDAAEEKPDGTA